MRDTVPTLNHSLYHTHSDVTTDVYLKFLVSPGKTTRVIETLLESESDP